MGGEAAAGGQDARHIRPRMGPGREQAPRRPHDAGRPTEGRRWHRGAFAGRTVAGGLSSGTVAHLRRGCGNPPGRCATGGERRSASAVFSDPARILVGTGTGSPIGTGITTAAFDPPTHPRRPRPPARHARARRPAGGGLPRGPRRHPPCPGRERPRAHDAVRSGAAARPARPAPIRVRRRVGMTRLRIRGGTQPRVHILAHLGGCATAPGRGRVTAQIRKRGAAWSRNTARPRRLRHGLTCPRRGAAQWPRNRPRAVGPPPRRPASP